MYRVLALTGEELLFTDIENTIAGSKGVEIKRFTDTLRFLENFLSVHNEIVILDIDLLKEQTVKIIHIIRLICKTTPIMVILSKEKISDYSEVFSMGIMAYLIKPISAENMCDLLSSALKIKGS